MIDSPLHVYNACTLFNYTVSNSAHCVEWLDNTETQRMWNATIMAESETLFRHLPRGTEENKEKPEEGGHCLGRDSNWATTQFKP